jgi:hypothetical protein
MLTKRVKIDDIEKWSEKQKEKVKNRRAINRIVSEFLFGLNCY